MDRTLGIFVDGIGAAAATSGVLTQLQGRIFALLYLHDGPLSLDDIAAELGQRNRYRVRQDSASHRRRRRVRRRCRR